VRASVSDREQLQSLDPVEVASYLQAKGWQRTDSGYERATCWSFETNAGASLDLLVPTDATVGDFTLRMSELLQALEQVRRSVNSDIVCESLVRLRRAEAGNAEGFPSRQSRVKPSPNSGSMCGDLSGGSCQPSKLRKPASVAECQDVQMERGVSCYDVSRWCRADANTSCLTRNEPFPEGDKTRRYLTRQGWFFQSKARRVNV
jgi:hypothetical protein